MSSNQLPQSQAHRGARAIWLRAAVLGADDGIVSTASIMIGVAASSASKSAVLVAGTAGLVAGAMSMAIGEFVSVSSQRDVEEADIQLEKRQHAADPQAELEELERIYRERGLDVDLAKEVAAQLSKGDPVGTHLRDELGITGASRAQPMQAGLVSAASFASLGILPIAALVLAPASLRLAIIALVSLVSLAVLGAIGAYAGGAPMGKAALRVTAGGVLAMAITAVIGHLVGGVAAR